MLTLRQQIRDGTLAPLSADRVRAGLHNVLRTIFDVQRTRGKVREWYASVDDPMKVDAAQALGCVLRKIDFFQATSGSLATLPQSAGPAPTAWVPGEQTTASDRCGTFVASLAQGPASCRFAVDSLAPGRDRPPHSDRLAAARTARVAAPLSALARTNSQSIVVRHGDAVPGPAFRHSILNRP